MDKMFNSIDELMIYLQEQIPINLEIIGEEVKEILRNNVQQLWYGRSFTPHYYTRTFEYINSIVCSKAVPIGSGMYEVEIYFDTNLIHPYPSTNGNWPQHESIYGDDVSEFIPEWIEEGNNSPLFSYEGVHPTEDTKQWIEESGYFKNEIIKLLGIKGITCTII